MACATPLFQEPPSPRRLEKERGTHRPQNHSAPLPAIIIEAAGREYKRHARAPHARACARHQRRINGVLFNSRRLAAAFDGRCRATHVAPVTSPAITARRRRRARMGPQGSLAAHTVKCTSEQRTTNPQVTFPRSHRPGYPFSLRSLSFRHVLQALQYRQGSMDAPIKVSPLIPHLRHDDVVTVIVTKHTGKNTRTT